MKRKYEFMFILDVFDEQKTKEEVREILQRHEGNFINEEELGIKKLAYLIKKRENGFYYLVEIELPSESLKEINADIRLNEKILKYLVVIQEEKKLTKSERKKMKSKAKSKPSESETTTNEKEENVNSETETISATQENSSEN